MISINQSRKKVKRDPGSVKTLIKRKKNNYDKK